MQDLELFQDSFTGEFDIGVNDNGDFATVSGMSTAVLTSLLTDKRADNNEVVRADLRRGWIGDLFPPSPDFELGSKIWLTESSRAQQSTVVKAADYAKKSLSWMVSDGLVSNVNVTGELTGPRSGRLRIDIQINDGTITTEYVELWRQTSFKQSILPQRTIDPEAFTLNSIPGLLGYIDADTSNHSVDDDCGIISINDLAGNAGFSQPIVGRRPKRFLGTGGWFWRFDGTDDFITTNNQPFSSIEEGTIFFIYKPTASAVNGRRVLSFGKNGAAESVTGLSVIQDAANLVRLLGDNGNLNVAVAGGGPASAPIGFIFSWGPSVNGGTAETSNLLNAVDGSYQNDVQPPDQITIGAGFDGSNPDPTTAAGFEMSVFAYWGRRVTGLETVRLIDYANERIFQTTQGEPFSDCTFATDNLGFS